MAFELCGKTRAKLVDVDVQSLKLGQSELRPAVSLRFRVTLANDKLNMLDRSLLPFLYQRGSPAGKAQAALDGFPVVSDMPQLTDAAKRLGAIGWKEEQTGSTLTVYQGVTGDMNIVLVDGKRSIQKIEPKEGGTVDVTFDYDVGDLDAETMGELAVLKNHEPDIELTNPEPGKQKVLDDSGPELTPDLTPEKALEQSLQDQQTGKPAAKTRGPARTPIAKKIARNSAKQSRRGAKGR